MIFLTMLIVFSTGLLGFSCKRESGEVILVVNGEEVTREQYNKKYERIKEIYNNQGMNIEAMKAEFEEMIMEKLIFEELFRQAREEKNIEIESEQVESKFEAVKSRYEGEKEFEKRLKEYNISKDSLKEKIERQLMISELVDQIIDDKGVEVTEEEINEMYEWQKEKHLKNQKIMQSELSDDFGEGEGEGEKEVELIELEDMEIYTNMKLELEKLIESEKRQEVFDEFTKGLKRDADIEIYK